ncbi:MAG: Gmad2 immunoglobulin-like domain-containing protein [Actinomycetota bacterium]
MGPTVIAGAVLRLAALGSAMLLVGTACGSDPAPRRPVGVEPGTGRSSPAATPAATPSDPASPSPGESPGEVSFVVWFHEGEKLEPIHRTAPATPRIATAAMESLLAGPESPEAETGVDTQIPADTELNGVEISDGIGTVNLTRAFESGGGSASMFMRLGQVVCTMHQFETVRNVVLELDGERVEMFSGEGIDVRDPMRCTDFEDQLPPIVVIEPAPGATVGDPVTVSGNANVFEATVSARVVDSDGEVLDRGFATATCGTGCRGEFTLELSTTGAGTDHGTVEVWWDSAEDGSRQDVVRIPVNF